VFLDVDYTFDPAWSASVTFCYSDIYQKIGATGSSDRETGIGDTLVSAHWTPYDSQRGAPPPDDAAWIRSDPRLRLKLDGGVTVPTGDVRMPVENPGATPFSALQLGTGTFNPLLGANFRADWGGLAASLDARWLLPFYENRHDFQAGTYQLYSVAGEVVPIPAVRFALGFEFEHRGQDQIDGDSIPVGGGWRYLLHPQAVINPLDNFNIFLGASIPVYRRFKDPQIDSDVRWEVGVQLFF
jgi:hypothetical protein